MFLARVRTEDDRVVLAARIAPDTLLPLDALGFPGDDPIALLAGDGAERVRQALADDERVRQTLAGAATASLPVAAITFEPPVPRPQKIICVALNYLAHAQEGEQAVPEAPVIFFKPPSALVGHGATVHCPRQSQRLDYEVELAVVIGKTARDVPAERWRDVVLGYTVLNDITARDIQLVAIGKNQPWDHSKGFDTFAPCGPYLVTADEVADPMSLDLELTVGEEVRQRSNTRHMIFGIPQLIEVISHGITLEPGDIIATGTPSGIGPVPHGETMVATVETVGVLSNPVVYDSELSAAVG